jgi:hypothetical protein
VALLAVLSWGERAKGTQWTRGSGNAWRRTTASGTDGVGPAVACCCCPRVGWNCAGWSDGGGSGDGSESDAASPGTRRCRCAGCPCCRRWRCDRACCASCPLGCCRGAHPHPDPDPDPGRGPGPGVDPPTANGCATGRRCGVRGQTHPHRPPLAPTGPRDARPWAVPCDAWPPAARATGSTRTERAATGAAAGEPRQTTPRRHHPRHRATRRRRRSRRSGGAAGLAHPAPLGPLPS